MAEALDTVNRRFADAARKYSDRPALSSKPPGSKAWQTLTYREVESRIRRFSLGLRALGVARGDRVALLSENRPEWVIADLAILAAGAVTVPIYPTLPPAQVAHILADSGAKAVVISDVKQMVKVEEARAAAPDLQTVIVMEDAAATGDALSFDAVMRAGDEATLDESYEARHDSVRPDDLMSLVYTSGTTGNPKGAMLTHGNMTAALDGAVKAFPITPPDETFLSFLPLCHIFERITSFLSITLGAQTYYNDSIFRLMDNLAEVKPTVMQNVPRVFETIYERVMDGVAKAPPLRQKLFHWAVSIGDKAGRRHSAGRSLGPLLALQLALADRLVLSKIRARFGGNLKFFVSGGAALSPKVADFFHAIGIPIQEGWGLTETTAPATINPYGRAKIGTVGTAGWVSEVRSAPDGELLVKGPNVMRGYWNNPEATAEVIDADGWFHTGDIGEIDADGYVRITDRKKDILVLPNGKKVAPQPIETRLRQSPFITEIVLLADQSGGVSALVIPNFEALKAWAKAQGKDLKDAAALIADSAARKQIKSEIDRLSGDLADFEKVKRFALLDKTFTIEGGELTPTLKVKRKIVAEKYGKLLEKE